MFNRIDSEPLRIMAAFGVMVMIFLMVAVCVAVVTPTPTEECRSACRPNLAHMYDGECFCTTSYRRP